MGLLEFAAKYLPELEKMSGQEGEGNQPRQNPLDVLRKQLKKNASHQSKPPQQKAVKKQSSIRSHRAFNTRHAPPQAFVHSMHHPASQWIPHHSLPPKMAPQYIPSQIPYLPHGPPVLGRMKKRKTKVSSNTKRELKTGTMISNVSNALEDFKRRRDKFLNYLAQLQDDLNKLNLPSASKEKMELRESDLKKKDTKKRKKKSHKIKALAESKTVRKRLEATTSEVTLKKKIKANTAKKEDKKQKMCKLTTQSTQNFQEWREE